MSRHKINLQEGVLDERANMIVEHGAVKMGDESIPVTLGFDGPLVGKASKMQRDQDGHITMEIELFDGADPEALKLAELKGLSWVLGSVTEKDKLSIITDEESEPRVITGARLRQLADTSPWLAQFGFPQVTRGE